MTWKTHLIGGAQAGALLTFAFSDSVVDSAIIVSTAMLGSVLPDIDHPSSKLAKSDAFVGLLSFALSKVTKHRGFTHTICGAMGFSVIFYMFAVFRSEKDSLIAFFSALAIFIVMHAAGSAMRWLAGWMAVIVYAMGPQVAEFFTAHNITVSVNEHSARLCASAMFAGCLMHMVYDTFNKGGVSWLYPASARKFRLLTIKTNTLGEVGFAAVQILILSAVLSVCFKDTYILDWINSLFDAIKER